MYIPPSNSIWKGRIDDAEGNDSLRWHQMVQLCDLLKVELPVLNNNQRGIILIGFRCDEGVKRNKGRAGAADGPDAIRKACVNFAWHFEESSCLLFDGGDIECEGSKLEEAQAELADLVETVIKQDFFPLILGGGHEVSFGGYRGAFQSQHTNNDSIGVINFDAHFDLRNYKQGGSSGTPFLQIAELCSSNQTNFNYLCMGIQPHANTRTLFDTAEELNVTFLTGENLIEDNIAQINKVIQEFIDGSDQIYLTIDLDVFDMSDAPGVSAPAVPGVDKRVVVQLLKSIFNTGRIIAADIAEMNPEFDIDNRTAKLAAFLVFFIFNNQ